MAKGLRSSTKKTNRSKLKKGVFGPVETARTERLSAKLLELAQQAKPERTEMEVEMEETKKGADDFEAHVDGEIEAMDVDGVKKTSSNKTSAKRSSGRIEKKSSRHTKPRNQIAFKNRGRPGDKLSKSKRRRL